MGAMTRLAAVLTVAVAAGCARFPAAPAEGGPLWTELTSEHFTVWTDADPSRVSERIREMERFRHVVAAVVYPAAPSSGRALAVVVRNERELSEVNSNGESRAFAADASAPLWQPIMVLALAGGGGQFTMVHELTHLISFSVIHHQPRWLAEGMATYFETAQLDAAQTQVLVGAAGRYGYTVDMAPPAALFNWGGSLPLRVERLLYQTAFALFAFLINEHKAELAHYLWLVDRTGDPANGPPQVQLQRAWEQAFPSLPVGDLEDRLGDWLRNGSHQELTFHVRPRDLPITARQLSDADAYAIRAMLLGGPTPEQQLRELEERSRALALEPTNVLAWAAKVAGGRKPTADEGRAIAAAHPDDWRAWWLAAVALENGGAPGELDRARRQACALLALNGALVAPPRLCPADLHASTR
jgi:hypothetical protein